MRIARREEPAGQELRRQAEAIGVCAIDPSQVKVNWQPVARVEPWNTTPHTLDG